MASANTIELAQTGKRDRLRSIEKKYQEQWEAERFFEIDPPTEAEIANLTPAEVHQKYPKWMGTFPYPYMNGALHLGHAFTISKIEFAAGFERMLGKRALFPHGFHCTGIAISAAADKIAREMEMFGANFENYTPPAPVDESDAPPAKAGDAKAASSNPGVFKAKKGKVAAKSTGHLYQFQVMKSLGIPTEDIKKFADPYYWTKYFPPIAKADQHAFGTRIDWRRTFITTDANPFYDSFVRWQTNKLYKLGKIKFGERYTIYSIKDGQPCMDHDRQSGEALGPQEYTCVKMEVVNWGEQVGDAVSSKADGRTVYLVAATLRPETMYGQTNCFVGTKIKYGVFAANDKEAYVCTYRAARNMAHQGVFTPNGEIKQLGEIEGSTLIGTKIKAPFGLQPEVFVLPMDNVLDTKGTGVVTSVPSDSPDDYATLMDLRKKAEYYKIDPSWAAIDPIPVLSTPTYGELTAQALVKQLKINSQKDVVQLAEAKEIAYKEGFYSGTMLVGEFKGQSVQDAKPKVRAAMIGAKLAFAYAEPEGHIVSRSGDECIVALMDQWYLDYGEKSWREQAEKVLARMNTFGVETRNGFEATLNWLNQWACARTYGLGSKLPWDPNFLVESLSDSTIYMSYYTVSRHLEGGTIYGAGKPGPLGVTPEQLTDEIWEYIFCDGPWPASSDLDRSKADTMKREFNYFYPLDVRSSGKDLIPNHLTFAIYNHAAIFPEDKWPLGMRTNGHLLLNGSKMSKGTGNFLTLRNTLEKFGADATRLALADAGDGIEDANFDEKSANANILRVHTLIDWCEEVLKDESHRTGPRNSYHDEVFEQEINDLIEVTKASYEKMNYKDALKTGFYDLQLSRDWYREVTQDIGMHADLVRYWIRTSVLLIAPVAPHFADYIWTELLKEPKSIQLALYPAPSKPVDRTIIESATYMRGTTKGIRDAEAFLIKKQQKVKDKTGLFDSKKPKSVRLYVATAFPEWQDRTVQAVKDSFDEAKGKVDDVKVRELLTREGLLKDKRTMPFVQELKKRIDQFGATTAFKRTLPFSEAKVLGDLIPYFKRNLNLVDVEVYMVDDAKAKTEPGFTKTIIEGAEPGSPAVEYRNV